MKWRGSDIPSGIRLRAVPAQKSEPFLAGRLAVGGAPTPRDDCPGMAGPTVCGMTQSRSGCYAESDDGTTWRQASPWTPRVDGNTANNILWGRKSTAGAGLHRRGVRLHRPLRPRHRQRYKSFHNRHIDAEVSRSIAVATREDTSPRAQLGIERGKGTLGTSRSHFPGRHPLDTIRPTIGGAWQRHSKRRLF